MHTHAHTNAHLEIPCAASTKHAQHKIESYLHTQTHTHQRPEYPTLTAHLDLAACVGARARVGFCCQYVDENAANESTGDKTRGSTINEGSTQEEDSLHEQIEIPRKTHGEGAEEGTLTDVHSDMDEFRIRSWSLEINVREAAAGTRPDAARVREAASTELTALLQGLEEIGQSTLLGSEKLQVWVCVRGCVCERRKDRGFVYLCLCGFLCFHVWMFMSRYVHPQRASGSMQKCRRGCTDQNTG